MKRVIVLCEGPTEETFVNRLLKEELFSRNIFLSASSLGGVSKYSIIRKRLIDLCKNDPSAIVTTMLDYYGIPSALPGLKEKVNGDIYTKVRYIEESFKKDIGMCNFIPNLMLHEFEGLLFSKPECFNYCKISLQELREFSRIGELFETPEHINNSPETAPSKRILRIYPQYSKILDGYNIASDIGIAVIREKCRHFNEWLVEIENL